PFIRNLIIISCLALALTVRADDLELWYRQPAGSTNWTSALPIGNGRIAAMIFGGTSAERLQLNEGTLWPGGPYDPNNSNALAALPEVRALIFPNQFTEASALVGQKMMAIPVRQMPYETVGDLFLNFSDATNTTDYRRDLNLDTAIAHVSYTLNGVKF